MNFGSTGVQEQPYHLRFVPAHTVSPVRKFSSHREAWPVVKEKLSFWLNTSKGLCPHFNIPCLIYHLSELDVFGPYSTGIVHVTALITGPSRINVELQPTFRAPPGSTFERK